MLIFFYCSDWVHSISDGNSAIFAALGCELEDPVLIPDSCNTQYLYVQQKEIKIWARMVEPGTYQIWGEQFLLS